MLPVLSSCLRLAKLLLSPWSSFLLVGIFTWIDPLACLARSFALRGVVTSERGIKVTAGAASKNPFPQKRRIYLTRDLFANQTERTSELEMNQQES